MRACFDRRVDERLEGEHVRTVWLVQPILHRVSQRVKLGSGEAVDKHRGARDVKDSIFVRKRLGQRRARLLGRHFVVWDEEHALQTIGKRDPLRDPLLLRLESDLKAAVDGGRDVVGAQSW